MLLTAWIGALTLAQAEPERLVRCEVELSLPSGSTLSISGWSDDEDRAAHRAEVVAWAAAEWSTAPEQWSLLTVAPEVAHERLAGTLIHAGRPPRVPGFAPDAVSAPRCTKELAPRVRGDDGFAATWPGSAEVVVRSTAGTALEAARRRACLGPFQLGPFSRLAHVNPAASLALRHNEELRDLSAALLRCLSRVPDPMTALEAGPAHPVPPPTGVVQCSRPVQGEGLVAAWGVDLEDAREATLWQSALLESSRAIRESLVDGVPETDGSGPDHLRGLVIPDDAAEQALLACAEGPREQAVTIEWAARDKETSTSCGLPEPVSMALPDSFWLTASPGRFCRSHAAERGIAAVIPALGEAGEEAPRLAALGWRRALRCEARCTTDLRVRGWAAVPLRRPGELDRSSPESALAALDVAIEDRNLSALGVLTGGVLLAPIYRDLHASDPDSLWDSLRTSRTGPDWERTTTWMPVHGHFLLAFLGE